MEKIVKILTAGEGGVGKTTFLNRYINNNFVNNFTMTRGIQFFGKTMKSNGSIYNLVLWDFAGQYCYRHLLSNLVKGSSGAFFLFDLTRISSIDRIEEWMHLFTERENKPVLLVGTKCDLITPEEESKYTYFTNEIKKRFRNCIGYIKTSSKTGVNIDLAFNTLLNKIFTKNNILL
ncbi:MAG: Rab family GTPase [Candidatus Hermodarchaeota archaeon]